MGLSLLYYFMLRFVDVGTRVKSKHMLLYISIVSCWLLKKLLQGQVNSPLRSPECEVAA